ncbi:MAG: PfkB family carbohydrate kinase [Magnetospirillum sp. WYHS-4]
MSEDNGLRGKLKTLDELSALSRQARDAGRTVVQCHGTFDLLHVGHLRHLRSARAEGDLLIVTLTGDAHVNKGPGRPAFAEPMRAEMLAALECVDYVGICQFPLAVEAIEAIRPAVYAKGKEYEKSEEDVTGGIVDERRAVEAHGGRLVFTDDATFSSSSLINRYLSVFDPNLDEYLQGQRARHRLAEYTELLDRIKDYRVLMIGDAIIDDYKYVSAIGKSPKEHIIATQFSSREVFAGGVFAAANHVADFCREVEVVTTIGRHWEYEKVIRDSMRWNVKLHMFRRETAPTTRKTRYVDRSYLRKMFEVYHMDDTPTAPDFEREIVSLIENRGPEFDLVIVTDFGHGLITPSTIAALERSARFLAVNTQSNSANMGYNLITRYPRADYVCIDAPEARLAVSDRLSDIAEVVGRILPSRIDCPRIVVTTGREGCLGYTKGEKTLSKAPAFTKTVVDTVGAGDAFFVLTAPLAAAGASMEQMTFVGNAVGAIKVGIVGHRRSVERIPLVKFMTTLLK